MKITVRAFHPTPAPDLGQNRPKNPEKSVKRAKNGSKTPENTLQTVSREALETVSEVVLDLDGPPHPAHGHDVRAAVRNLQARFPDCRVTVSGESDPAAE